MNLFFGDQGTLLNRGVEAILGFKGGEKEWKRADNGVRSDLKRGSLEMVLLNL